MMVNTHQSRQPVDVESQAATSGEPILGTIEENINVEVPDSTLANIPHWKTFRNNLRGTANLSLPTETIQDRPPIATDTHDTATPTNGKLEEL